LFSEYLCDGRYGWAAECEKAFGPGVHPMPFCHEWNTIAVEYPRDVWRLHKLPGIAAPSGRPCPHAGCGSTGSPSPGCMTSASGSCGCGWPLA
jgi:hypothetical protein